MYEGDCALGDVVCNRAAYCARKKAAAVGC